MTYKGFKMERQYKYRVNRNIALNELVESTVSNRRVSLSPWSHDSDWDFYDSLETDKKSYYFTAVNKEELSLAERVKLEYNISMLNERLDNMEIDVEMLVNTLPLFE